MTEYYFRSGTHVNHAFATLTPAGGRYYHHPMIGIERRALSMIVVLLAAGVVLAMPASAERVEDVPNPITTAGRAVGDNAGVLGPGYAELIDGICTRLKNATGAELAVVTIRDLGGTVPEDFAERLFKRFGIGEKGKDNGLLLLFAVDDRAVRFEVGYGLEPVIPDARAGQLLDEFAIPFLARGEHGRGLYAVAKAAAEVIAAASGASLGLADPDAWPEQPRPVQAEDAGQKASLFAETDKPVHRTLPALPFILAAALLVMTGLWILLALRRFGRSRSKAARLKAARAGVGYWFLMWTAAIGAGIAMLKRGGSVLSLLGFALAPVASNFLWTSTRRAMKKKAAEYHLPCRSCGSPMDLVPEDEDDARLSVEEAAEEMAGGMDYELWICPQCGAKELFSVKLGKARACPQCTRRTLVRAREVLVAATTAHGGRERITDACRNPKCGYRKSWERDTPRIVPAASSSGGGRSGFSGSSRSGRSSFGGGRSGGGGASRRF